MGGPRLTDRSGCVLAGSAAAIGAGAGRAAGALTVTAGTCGMVAGGTRAVGAAAIGAHVIAVATSAADALVVVPIMFAMGVTVV